MHTETAHVSAIVYAQRLPLVAAFYEQALRLEQVESEPTHVLLVRGAVEVAIVQVPEAIAEQFTVSVPPALRADTPIKASFLVETFESVRTAAERTGGALKPESAAWSWRGHRHLDGNDPYGNIVQFRVVEQQATVGDGRVV